MRARGSEGWTSRLFLGRPEHWAVLLALGALLWAMGTRHAHVRAFVPFTLALLVVVAASLALVVWRHRPGHRVTREPFEDALLPHGGREEEEV